MNSVIKCFNVKLRVMRKMYKRNAVVDILIIGNCFADHWYHFLWDDDVNTVASCYYDMNQWT